MDDAFLYLAPVSGEVAGEEMLAGIPCSKLKIEVDGHVLYLWVDRATRLPKKLESANGRTSTEWQTLTENVNFPEGYFSLPKGLKYIDIFALPQPKSTDTD